MEDLIVLTPSNLFPFVSLGLISRFIYFVYFTDLCNFFLLYSIVFHIVLIDIITSTVYSFCVNNFLFLNSPVPTNFFFLFSFQV